MSEKRRPIGAYDKTRPILIKSKGGPLLQEMCVICGFPISMVYLSAGELVRVTNHRPMILFRNEKTGEEGEAKAGGRCRNCCDKSYRKYID